MTVPTVKLSSGYEMPLFGLRTWQSGPGEVRKAVEVAIKAGYTHIDCAWLYNNQVEIGETLKRLFSSGDKRENIFITSKVWNTFHSAPACKHVVEILDQLQLKYTDLMLIHFPVGYEEGGDPFPKIPGTEKTKHSNEDYVITWKVLEDFAKEGKVGKVGEISSKHWHFDFQPQANRAVNRQQHYKIGCSTGTQWLVTLLYRGLAYGTNIETVVGLGNQASDGTLVYFAVWHSEALHSRIETPARVALRWAVQQDVIIIPKSTSQKRIKENAAVFDFQLTDAEMKEIEKLDRGWRLVDLSASDSHHPHFPFLKEY